ncbi:aldehyde dehydrogenase family protein [Neobacillus drentensis]|uniref:aldehyde dehydrogenase family protein n=1 Tax=Neobacillus drentensis TaxID=220684 RepID=UPI00286005A2|nr:aldehyde dehydrogenase family protein [Neobacillus drentensis]MDR7236409.1 acyl-CoA reductase-like NAD-dependent aldehyde dehydrogenase [Neobacillus drentensis]
MSGVFSMTKPCTGLYINGEWLESNDKMKVYDKYTQEVIGEVAVAGQENIDAAIQAANDAMANRPLPAHERYEILKRTAELVSNNTEEIATLIAREGGKPLKDATAEVNRAVQVITLASEEAKRIHGETVSLDSVPGSENRMGLYIRVPVGVVAAIAPFNFPINLVVHKVAPAIAAGCAVVLKPASTTPLTAVYLCKLLEEAGLPKGYVNLVIGSGRTIGDYLVAHQGKKFITFTGSPSVGKRIKENSGFNRVTLELGNNSGNIVHQDADLDLAADLLAKKAFGSAGQFCVSVQRIYVHENVLESFSQKIVEATKKLIVGNPLDPITDIGPLISLEEAERVEQWIQEAVEGGAEVLTGGSRNGVVVQPTLLKNVKPEMKVVCDEVFGPVASIIPYKTFNEAIDLVNDSEYGLQAGVFTRNIDLAWRAAKNIHAGGVIINDTSSYRADIMPYGGIDKSGAGREGPRFAVEEMTEIRMVVFNVQAGE